MKFILMLLMLMVSLTLSGLAYDKPVNKTQLCEMYYDSFITSADIFSETNSCLDATYSVLSFKQLLLTQCEIDKDDIEIAKMMYNIDKNCSQ
jgi:hypothetical protein